ncbi:MAG: cupin domain-containing protein [Nitrospirales bacterium]
MESRSCIDRSTVAKDWNARGFSCGVWIDHAGREWKGATHETGELFMVMSGELELEMEGKRFQPSVGEEIHIPNDVPYTIRNIGGTTARWLYGQKRKHSAALQPIESISDLIHSPL